MTTPRPEAARKARSRAYRRGLQAATVVPAVLVLAACTSAATGGAGATGSSTQAAPTTGGAASYALNAGEYFNWMLPIETPAVSEPYNWATEMMMYQPLYFEGKGSKPGIDEKQSLAYPPVWSNHDTTVTINLKHYKWSDGTPVTSRDVQFWYNLAAANKSQNDYYTPGQLPDNIKDVSYPSSTQIVFHLKRAYSEQWFDNNQLTWIIPMPQHVWDKTSPNGKLGNYDKTPTGARRVFTFLAGQAKTLSTYASNPLWKTVDGPWKLQGYDPTTHNTTLVPNTRYSGPDKPKLAKFTIESFTSNQSEVNALRSGQLTFGYLTAPDYTLKSYFASHGYTIKPWFPQFMQWAELGYTSKRYGPLVKQLYIRQALQRVVNQSLYNKTIFHGLGLPTYGPVPNTPGSPYVSAQEKTNLYPYSVAAAMKLLTGHGWAKGASGYMVCKHPGGGPSQCGNGIAAGRELELSLMYTTGWPGLLAQTQSYVQSAKQAGIKLSLNPQSETSMVSIGGVCPPGPCNYGMLIYENWLFNYGQGAILLSGDTAFATGNFWAGGYSDKTMDTLIQNERRQTGLQSLFAWEDYTQRQLPVIFFPTVGTWSVVKNSLVGWQQQNAYGYAVPSQWAFTK